MYEGGLFIESEQTAFKLMAQEEKVPLELFYYTNILSHLLKRNYLQLHNCIERKINVF